MEACEPPRRLLVTMALDEPDEDVIEATLAAEGDQTVLVWEERGMPVDQLAGYAAGCRSMSKISPLTWPGVSTAMQPLGSTSCSCLSTVGRQHRLVTTQTTQPDAGLDLGERTIAHTRASQG